MKNRRLLLTLLLAGCNANQQSTITEGKTDTVVIRDTIVEKKGTCKETQNLDSVKSNASLSRKIFSNERFKDVQVEQTGDHKFIIKGKAQVFEAQFSWVIEDGHEELEKGSAMTDAGAPGWGNFNFTVDVLKKRVNSTLHLILFEASPKDGSRQYQLPLLLY
jgi:hypothetical protein